MGLTKHRHVLLGDPSQREAGVVFTTGAPQEERQPVPAFEGVWVDESEKPRAAADGFFE